MADTADDAGAGDDALGGDRVGVHVPLQPRQEQQGDAHDEDHHPDRHDAPGLPGGGGHDRGDDAEILGKLAVEIGRRAVSYTHLISYL